MQGKRRQMHRKRKQTHRKRRQTHRKQQDRGRAGALDTTQKVVVPTHRKHNTLKPRLTKALRLVYNLNNWTAETQRTKKPWKKVYGWNRKPFDNSLKIAAIQESANSEDWTWCHQHIATNAEARLLICIYYSQKCGMCQYYFPLYRKKCEDKRKFYAQKGKIFIIEQIGKAYKDGSMSTRTSVPVLF